MKESKQAIVIDFIDTQHLDKNLWAVLILHGRRKETNFIFRCSLICFWAWYCLISPSPLCDSVISVFRLKFNMEFTCQAVDFSLIQESCWVTNLGFEKNKKALLWTASLFVSKATGGPFQFRFIIKITFLFIYFSKKKFTSWQEWIIKK